MSEWLLAATKASGGVVEHVKKFLRDPEKQPIVMVARPTVSKNAIELVTAFGQSAKLRERANLVLLMGDWCEYLDLILSPCVKGVEMT